MNTVTVRDLVLGDGKVRICVPVIAHTYEELSCSLEQACSSNPDLLEFRADFYFEDETPALKAIRSAAGSRPVLYTIRTREEGGEIAISDEAYMERCLAAAQYVDLVDVQLGRLHAGADNTSAGRLHSDLVARLQKAGVKVILSWHDFTRTPSREEMVNIMRRMQQEGGDISKIAVMPQNRTDVLNLMAASVEMAEKKADRPFITMAMGNLGRVTRAAAAFTGSCVSFGTAGMMSAPGQISAGALRTILQELN